MQQENAKPQLTISLLISNRLDTIRRCLDSLRPIMEALPCELILIDTSKNPVVHEILLEYTSQVYEFEWVKDFAKARNEGLRRAKGEWFLFLDDDEWFVDVGDLIDFFQTGEYKNYGYACHRIRNFFDVNYVTYSDGWVSRLIRIDEDTAFVGKVHEAFHPIRGQRKDLDVLSYHSGYIYETEEKRRAHFERNTVLLLEAIQEEPDNMRWYMQLMQEYGSVKEWDALVDCSQKAIEILKDAETTFDKQQKGAFVVGQIWAKLRKGAYQECIESGDKFLQDGSVIEVAKALVNLRMAEAFLALGETSEAFLYANRYLDAARGLSLNGENNIRKNSVPYLGEAFEDNRIKNAYAIIMSVKLQNRDYAQLDKCYEKLGWKQMQAYSYGKLERDILEAIADSEYRPIFSEMITDAYRNRGLRNAINRVFEEMDSNENLDESSRRRLMYAYAKADGDAPTLWYARAYMADLENREDDLVEAIVRYYDCVENVFVVPKGLIDIAARRQLDIEQCWNSIDPERWMRSVDAYVADENDADMDVLLENTIRIFGEGHWKCQVLKLRLLQRREKISDWIKAKYEFYGRYYRTEEIQEQTLMETYDKAKTIETQIEEGMIDVSDEKIEESLQEFMVSQLEFALLYLKEETFSGDMEMLVSPMRAAVWLNEYFGQTDAATEDKIALLREAVKCYPALAEPVKRLASYLASGQKGASVELMEMVSAMKKKIQALISQGLVEEALSIVTQVRTFVVEDEELAELEVQLQNIVKEG